MQKTEFALNLLLALAFVMLYRRDKRPYLFFWAAALIAIVFQNLVNLLAVVAIPKVVAIIVGRVLNLVGSLLSVWGAHAFFGDNPSSLWLPIVGIAFFWSFVGPALSYSAFWSAFPVYLVVSALLAATAKKVIAGKHPGVGHYLAGAGFVTAAVYAFSLSWFFNRSWFPIVEEQFDFFMPVVISIGIFTLHNENARADAERSAERYESVFSNAIEGVFVADGEGFIVSANMALARIFGYEEPKCLEGHSIDEILFCKEMNAKELCEDRITNMAVDAKSKDGKALSLRVNLLRHRNSSGEVERIEGSVQDVTKENAFRERLHQAQRMESMGRLAGGIAHDFNNLLTAIHGSVQLALVGSDFKPKVKEHLKDSIKAVECARDMTSQLLSFARFQPMEQKSINVQEVLDRTVKLFGRTLPNAITLKENRMPEELYVQAGETQIEQIVMNLLANARAAIADKGEISIELLANGDTLQLSIRDTGKGIPKEELGKIF